MNPAQQRLPPPLAQQRAPLILQRKSAPPPPPLAQQWAPLILQRKFAHSAQSVKREAQLDEETAQLLGQAAKLSIQLDPHVKYTVEQHASHVDMGMRYVKLLLEKQV